MPTIPHIVSRQPLGAPGISVGAAELPGEATARAGADVFSIGQQMQDREMELRRLNDYSATSAQASLAIDKAVNDEKQNPDFRTAPQRIDKAIQDISSETLSQVRDPQVKAQLQDYLTKSRDVQLINARDFRRQKEIQYGRGTFANSLDASRQKAEGLSGVEYDQELAHQQGLADAAIAAGLFTPLQVKGMMDAYYVGVESDRARKRGAVDPVGTIDDLVSGKGYSHLSLDQRLTIARQVSADANARKRISDQARQQAMDADVTNATEQAVQGKLTLDQLDALKNKYGTGGFPLPANTFEHLFDLINKPVKQHPSDPNTSALIIRAMNNVIPAIGQDQLWNLYQLGPENGGINLDDYTTFSNALRTRMNYVNDRANAQIVARAGLAEQIIESKYGGNPEVKAQALDSLSRTLRYGGTTDPLSILPELDSKLSPIIQAQQGLPLTGAIGQFNSALNAYLSALQAQHRWAMGWRGWVKNHIEQNPNDARVLDLRSDLLNKAKAAGRLLGDAAPNVPEGATWMRPDGKIVFVVGGKIIEK
jgi:hypothetical protein